MSWLDIKYAPRDGRLILLLCPGIGAERGYWMDGIPDILVGRWYEDEFTGHGEWVTDVVQDDGPDRGLSAAQVNPVRWAPIPEPLPERP